MPRIQDQEPDPPSAEAWAYAPTLEAVAGPAQTALISDGGGLPFAPRLAFASAAALDPADPAVRALLIQIEQGRRQAQPQRLLRPKARPAGDGGR